MKNKSQNQTKVPAEKTIKEVKKPTVIVLNEDDVDDVFGAYRCGGGGGGNIETM